MADQSEQIEAKLAAYIDGELSGGDREEIEKHLAANPAHLALVTDLLWHKQLIKGLPRELAPINMNEDLQSQLERDVLLSGGDPAEEARAVAGRIHRWPQIFSAAAILAMTAGLGAVVYSVLPGKHPTGVALENQTAPIVQPEKSVERPIERRSGDLVRGGARESMKGADQPATPLVAGGGGGAAGSGAAFRGGRGSAGKSAAGEVEETLVTVAEPETLVLAISGDDLDVAKGQVVRYLAANQLAYRAAGGEGSSLVRLANSTDTFNETAGEVLAQSSVLYKRRLEAGVADAAEEPRLTEAREGELALDPALRDAARSMEEKADESRAAAKVAVRSDSAGAPPTAAAGQGGQEQAQRTPAPDVVAQNDRRSRSIRPSPVRAEAPAQNTAQAAPPAPAPGAAGEMESVKAKGSELAEVRGASDSLVTEAHRFAEEQKIKLETSAGSGDAAGRVIVVRNINGRQVQELATRLKQAQAMERAAKDPATQWQVALFTPDQQRKLLGEQQAVALADQIVRTADSLESQQLAAWSRGEAEQRDRNRAVGEPTDLASRSDPIAPVVDAASINAPATRPLQPRSYEAPADVALARNNLDDQPPALRGGAESPAIPSTRPAGAQFALEAPSTRPTAVAAGIEQMREQQGQGRLDASLYAINGVVPANERAYFNCVIVLHNPSELTGVTAGALLKPTTQPAAAQSAPAAQTRPAR